MINVVVTQRVNAGMEEAFEAIAREITSNTLSQDEGCLRYEWVPCRGTANLHPDRTLDGSGSRPGPPQR